ncbi:AAA family ATPase [Tianweitania sp. BSSL-BM11]|uniref:AAA family ATPase n=1 Tax=Tianweitania aestuarii TaxID=2814886 RepID=A0ABS5RTE3_9HYPH|nr:AAA family ATPase [Tianweitania aestuarii]MBS9719597.1 AAA family ATPase [Tianweitania aestuarii]
MTHGRHVVLSGCSGGGKSTLLEELARRGFSVVAEPGRRIVEEELLGDGGALPWNDLAAFAERALDLAARDRASVAGEAGWVFFDRGLVDAGVALSHATRKPLITLLAPFARYHPQVFLTPPWPDIYRRDDGRQHGLEEAVAEYERLHDAYSKLGYEVTVLPKVNVEQRADLILHNVGITAARAADGRGRGGGR